MSDNGYVLAYRRAWTHRAFRDKLDAAIWNYLYQNAAWQEEIVTSHGTRHLIRRGQIFISMRGLATDFCCSESRIRTLTEHLAAHAMVTTQNAHRGVIITICNYDEYQSFENRERAQDASRPSAEHNAERALYNKEETKKERTKETKNEIILPAGVRAEAWHGMVEMRIKLKSPMTSKAKELMIGKLQRYIDAGHDPNAILEQSIMNGWKDIYEIKDNHYGNRNPTRQSSPSRQLRRFAEQDYDAGTEGFVLVD